LMQLLLAAAAAGTLAALAAGSLSPLIVASGNVFLAVEMVHAVLAAGVVGGLADALGWPLPPLGVAVLVVLALGLTASALVEAGLDQDTAVGVTAFASAVIVSLGLYVLVKVDPTGGSVLAGLLVGSVFYVTPGDLQALLTVAAVVLGFLYIFGREMGYVYFDPEGAQLAGARPWVYRSLLTSLVSVSAMGLTYVAGVLMAHILLVAPGVLALGSASRMGVAAVVAVSSAASVAAALLGIAIAWATGLNAAASVGLVLALAFTAYWLARRLRG
jgi:ABC-type Mn2+/Zn2+ transport system permease subunit